MFCEYQAGRESEPRQKVCDLAFAARAQPASVLEPREQACALPPAGRPPPRPAGGCGAILSPPSASSASSGPRSSALSPMSRSGFPAVAPNSPERSAPARTWSPLPRVGFLPPAPFRRTDAARAAAFVPPAPPAPPSPGPAPPAASPCRPPRAFAETAGGRAVRRIAVRLSALGRQCAASRSPPPVGAPLKPGLEERPLSLRKV